MIISGFLKGQIKVQIEKDPEQLNSGLRNKYDKDTQ